MVSPVIFLSRLAAPGSQRMGETKILSLGIPSPPPPPPPPQKKGKKRSGRSGTMVSIYFLPSQPIRFLNLGMKLIRYE